MSIWLDLYLADFNEPPSYPCLQRLRRFLKQAAPDSDLYNRVNHKFSKFCAEDERKSVSYPVYRVTLTTVSYYCLFKIHICGPLIFINVLTRC